MFDTPQPKNSNKYQLKVFVKSGLLNITVGTELFQHASFTYNPIEDLSKYKIVNEKKFFDDVIREMLREEEDGSTPLHRLFDQMVIAAIENGAESIGEKNAKAG